MNNITRRAVVLGGACLCHAAGPRPTCCSTPDLEPASLAIGEKALTIDLAQAHSLAEVGGAASIIDKPKSVAMIVVRTGKRQYIALARFCTHGGHQPVTYNPRRNILQCNGYNHSIFGLDGRVVKGPAPLPLKSYPVKLAAGKLEIVYA